MIDQVQTHGVLEQYKIQGTNDITLEQFYRKGFVVLPQILTETEVHDIKNEIYNIYERQCKEVGGEENLKKINETNVVRSMFVYSDVFIDLILLNQKLEFFINKLLDNSYTLYSQVAVINKPHNPLYQIKWHREIQYQHFTSSRPMAVQTIFALDPFNKKTGGTYFLPYSHLFEDFPSDQFVLGNQFQPELNAGDVVLMNSMVYHRAGLNTSNNDRVLITNTYTRPILMSQFNYPEMIDLSKYSSKVQEVLGGRWNYSSTMLNWRKTRISG